MNHHISADVFDGCPTVLLSLFLKIVLSVQMALASAVTFGLFVGFIAIRHRAMARWNTVAGLAIPALFLVRDAPKAFYAAGCVKTVICARQYSRLVRGSETVKFDVGGTNHAVCKG